MAGVGDAVLHAIGDSGHDQHRHHRERSSSDKRGRVNTFVIPGMPGEGAPGEDLFTGSVGFTCNLCLTYTQVPTVRAAAALPGLCASARLRAIAALPGVFSDPAVWPAAPMFGVCAGSGVRSAAGMLGVCAGPGDHMLAGSGFRRRVRVSSGLPYTSYIDGACINQPPAPITGYVDGACINQPLGPLLGFIDGACSNQPPPAILSYVDGACINQPPAAITGYVDGACQTFNPADATCPAGESCLFARWVRPCAALPIYRNARSRGPAEQVRTD